MIAQSRVPTPPPTDHRWQEQAACTDHDPELWWPARMTDRHDTDPPRTICAGCPVRVECLHYAVAVDARDGIWGGTLPHERVRFRPPPTTGERCGTIAGYVRHLTYGETTCDDCRAAANQVKKAKQQRRRHAPCADCGRTMPIQARRLCGACCARHKANGTLDHWPRQTRPAADTAEHYTELAAQGYSRARAADRLGVTVDAIDQALRRARDTKELP